MKMKKKLLELAVYGVASIISGTLFFFGLMYPEYLYTEESYAISAPEDTEELWGISAEEFDDLSQQEKVRLLYELDGAHIRYKSKLWEVLHK